VSRLLAFPRPGVDPERALRALRASLGPPSHFHPDDAEAVQVFDLARFSRLVDLFYAGFMVFVGLAGTITLLIAGVGIANYQLSIVAERTVEIGVARALGARARTVVLQTACESLVIAGLAALVGTAFGLVVLIALRHLPASAGLPPPIVSVPSAIVSLVATAGVAVVAATIPALQVRRIDVGIALRESI
jgi:putative ABC transport system permease protein